MLAKPMASQSFQNPSHGMLCLPLQVLILGQAFAKLLK